MSLLGRIPPPLRTAVVILAVVCVLVAAGVISAARLNPAPPQPIPFSHKLHAGTKEIGCIFCHPGAIRASRAGMPSVEKCLLCHDVIASKFPPIARIKSFERKDKGIPWVRVNRVPDHVHFNHRTHLGAGLDCSECHFNVKAMDRITEVRRFDMNFCITCHDDSEVSVDCYTCHY